jgi:hypothetical protein
MEIFFSVDDSFYTSEIFQSFVAFIGDISKPTQWYRIRLYRALKQFDAQNDKNMYLIPYGSVFWIENGRF